MTALRQPDPGTRANQERASNPASSAWVSAHAGSGKTHVLASRVIRLLLEGVPPARILCLTFTKAAAANMASRVFGTLAQWAVADDELLPVLLARIGAEGRNDLGNARKLFARAVESPGGLKVQTIHAFCERVLHLFPFEANVAADFRVLEEVEQAQLLADAQRFALAELAEHNPASLARVAEGTWDGGFVELIAEMLGQHRRILASTDRAVRAAARRSALGLRPDDTENALRESVMCGGLHHREWRSLADRIAGGTVTDRKCADRLRAAAAAVGTDAAVDNYFAVFRTSNNGWQQRIVTASLAKSDPALAVVLEGELARLQTLHERWRGVRIASRTDALETVCGAVINRYERFKHTRGLLDFDDLIVRSNDLLNHSHVSDWVLYKLDGGIDHILVDEAQDTSEAQWRILRALAGEFTAGAGRPRKPRTFFAVGDEKQSIFSFQGAAPHKFDEMRREFSGRASAADVPFQHVRLHMSFRSAPPILHAVDTLFADPTRRQGLSTDEVAPSHQALKASLPGLVEIWETIGATEADPPNSWLLPVDTIGAHEPPARLAHKVATKIGRLLEGAYREGVEGATPGSIRPVRPGDIMILVRRRDAFFEAVIRALKDKRIPVAGADRLDVVGHIAVMDCIAAARVALLPDDDLSLATVLKSPLIGLTDDDLIALAPGRSGSLHAALCASTVPSHAIAAARIAAWRKATGRSPFEFFSVLLGAEGGRRALLSRLGAEANDALDEFLALALAHERTHAPSITTFLASLETLTLDVKRDLEASGDAVRVMTVHAAKGLEAKIVFLPDTCGAPGGQHDPKIFRLDTPAGPTIAWSAGKAQDPAALLAAREQVRRAQEEEYRRLLYVAMTRAEERLYIAGFYNKEKPKETCWHSMIWTALEPVATRGPDPLDEHATVLRIGVGQTLPEPPESAEVEPSKDLPAWLREPAPVETGTAPPLRPSSALAGADVRSERERMAPTRAALRGLAAHGLLRRLPDLSPSERETRALTLLRARWPDLSDAESACVARDVLKVLADPALAALFAPGSLAEVPFAADLPRPGRTAVRISGQIDRLVEDDDAVMVADFKTGSAPAESTPAHLAQIALYTAALRQIYPGKPIRPLLVFTTGPTIVAPGGAELADALRAALDRAP